MDCVPHHPVGISEAENLLLSKKLQALKEGIHTDCTFIVGANCAESKKFSGLKRDFALACSSSESRLNLKDEIHIRNISPNIFECILEFVHIGKCTKKISLVSDAIALVKGAKFLKIEAVVMYGNHLIMNLVRVDTVWEILDAVSKYSLDKCITEVCCKLLSVRLLDCIKHQSFLSASQESVVTLLKIDTFYVNADEYCLLSACLKWISYQPIHSRKSTFKNLLPHLRILSLDGEVCAMISEYITETDQTALFGYFGTMDHGCERLPNFVCKNSSSRFVLPAQQSSIVIVPDALSKTRDSVYFSSMEDVKLVNSFRFVANSDLYLTGIQLLKRMPTENRVPVSFYKPPCPKTDRIKLRRNGCNEEEWEEDIHLTITNSAHMDWSKKMTVKVKLNAPILISFPIHFFVTKDSFTSVEIELLSPQGSYLRIEPSAVSNYLMYTESVAKTNDLSLKNLNDNFEYEDPLLYFIQSLKFILA